MAKSRGNGDKQFATDVDGPLKDAWDLFVPTTNNSDGSKRFNTQLAAFYWMKVFTLELADQVRTEYLNWLESPKAGTPPPPSPPARDGPMNGGLSAKPRPGGASRSKDKAG